MKVVLGRLEQEHRVIETAGIELLSRIEAAVGGEVQPGGQFADESDPPATAPRHEDPVSRRRRRISGAAVDIAPGERPVEKDASERPHLK